jgi:hypothetical protein
MHQVPVILCDCSGFGATSLFQQAVERVNLLNAPDVAVGRMVNTVSVC